MPTTNHPEHVIDKLPRTCHRQITLNMPKTNYPEQWACQQQISLNNEHAKNKITLNNEQANNKITLINEHANNKITLNISTLMPLVCLLSSSAIALAWAHASMAESEIMIVMTRWRNERIRGLGRRFGMSARLHGRVGNHDRDD